MPQVATFKQVEMESIERLAELLTGDAGLVAKLLEEVENEGLELPDSGCSGEIYTAIFDYLEAEKEIDCCDMGDFMELQDSWMEIREPTDLRIFTYEKAREMLAALSDADPAYIAEDWEQDEEAVAGGLMALESCLQTLDAQHCLLYLLD